MFRNEIFFFLIENIAKKIKIQIMNEYKKFLIFFPISFCFQFF